MILELHGVSEFLNKIYLEEKMLEEKMLMLIVSNMSNFKMEKIK